MSPIIVLRPRSPHTSIVAPYRVAALEFVSCSSPWLACDSIRQESYLIYCVASASSRVPRTTEGREGREGRKWVNRVINALIEANTAPPEDCVVPNAVIF